MRTTLVIPAAGYGSRFYKNLTRSKKNIRKYPSKLCFDLDGKEVLVHTINAFQGISQIKEIIVAISFDMRGHIKRWNQEVAPLKVKWTEGGNSRSESVFKALRKSNKKNSWVMVHDAARPFISSVLIKKVFSSLGKYDGVILAKRVIPTIKHILTEDKIIKATIDRTKLIEAETPQLFKRETLIKAYKQNTSKFRATDEANLLEMAGFSVKAVVHSDWNPKLTTPTDFVMAEAWMKNNKRKEIRVGLGFDIHKLVKGRKLYLGGIVIPSEKGALGHSDGDALLHAITDGILGTIGRGDIGEWFSDRNPKYKNIRSTKILKTVLNEAKKMGWRLFYIDSNIILETPKLSSKKSAIKKNLSKLLELDEKNISVKAKTKEGMGPEGEGHAISCEAIVGMERMD